MNPIRPARADDLPALKEIYLGAMRGLHAAGVDQWTEEYPLSLLPEDIERGELFILELDAEPAAAVALNDRADAWHQGVPWADQAGFYVHRLAVHPGHQGVGLSKALMRFAHERAAQKGFRWMHLDTNTKNARAIALYHGMGYTDVSIIREYGAEYVCMEKDLRA